MHKKLEISSLSKQSGARYMELATEIARAYSDEAMAQNTLFELVQGLPNSVEEMCGYAGKILAIRSLDDSPRISRATYGSWSRRFYHRSHVSEALGIVRDPCVLSPLITLESSEKIGLRRVDVEYSLLHMVNPQTFEPLVSVEVFDPR